MTQEYINLMEETLSLFIQKDEYQQKLVDEPVSSDREKYLKRIRELEGILAENMEKLKSLKEK